MVSRSGFRGRLREIHGDDVEITVTAHRDGSASAPRLNLFGVVLALPILVFLMLLVAALAAGVCAFVGVFAYALSGSAVVGWIGAGLAGLLAVGVLLRGRFTR